MRNLLFLAALFATALGCQGEALDPCARSTTDRDVEFPAPFAAMDGASISHDRSALPSFTLSLERDADFTRSNHSRCPDGSERRVAATTLGFEEVAMSNGTLSYTLLIGVWANDRSEEMTMSATWTPEDASQVEADLRSVHQHPLGDLLELQIQVWDLLSDPMLQVRGTFETVGGPYEQVHVLPQGLDSLTTPVDVVYP